jgi:hypothetical protein
MASPDFSPINQINVQTSGGPRVGEDERRGCFLEYESMKSMISKTSFFFETTVCMESSRSVAYLHSSFPFRR